MAKESPSGRSGQLDARESLGSLIHLIAFDERGPRDKSFFGNLLAMLYASDVGFDMPKVVNEINTRTAQILDESPETVELASDAKFTPDVRRELLEFTRGMRATLNAIDEAHVTAVIDECDSPEKLKALEMTIRILSKPEMTFSAGETQLPISGFIEVVARRLKAALES